MQAVVLRRGETRPALAELPRPEPNPGEALVRTLRVGVDGTDHEVIAGEHGGFPEGEDHVVLGHEAVGVVVDPNGTDLAEGQVVAPTVRRPHPDRPSEFFARGEPDMAPDGEYVERGIVGAHGFMAEYFTSPADCLVPVPDALARYGFLVEPISVSEKALEHARASRSAFDWRPESALVLGNGSLGLLTLAVLDGSFDRCYCLGRRDRPDPTIDVIERLGATYVDSRETPVDRIPDEFEPMDLIYEATGYARHPFEAVSALAPNGVAALVGVPGDWDFEVPGGRLHRELVLENKALVGSVNSNRGHFERAVGTLSELPAWVLDAVTTDVYDLAEFERAFSREGASESSTDAEGPSAFAADETTIKTAIQFHEHEER